MELTEQQIYAALDLEMPEESENTQEVAEPAAEEEQMQEATQSENTQEVAEPANELEENAEEAEEEPQEEKPAMSAEERRANAARRRQKELEDAKEEARKQERERFEEQIKQLFVGKTNPYTDKPIETLEDLAAFNEAERKARISRDLKAGNLTQEALDEAVKNSPIVKKAEQVLADAEKAKEETQSERFKQQAEQEIAQIAKLNPQIKTLNDIMAMPTGQQFAKYVRDNGLNFVDAYKLANQAEISKMQQAAAQQQLRNAAAGKSHLQPVQARGQEPVKVPEDVKREYRLFDPNMSDDEITKEYAKYLKTLKR